MKTLGLLVASLLALTSGSVAQQRTLSHPNVILIMTDDQLVAVNAGAQKSESFEFYNLKTDPYERTNLISASPKIAKDLKVELDRVYQNIAASPNLATRRIRVGTRFENPTVLTRQDWTGLISNWIAETGLGY